MTLNLSILGNYHGRVNGKLVIKSLPSIIRTNKSMETEYNSILSPAPVAFTGDIGILEDTNKRKVFEAFEENCNIYIKFIGNSDIPADSSDETILSPYHKQRKNTSKPHAVVEKQLSLERTLNQYAIKIDKFNIAAMIMGFKKNGVQHNTSIFCAKEQSVSVKDGDFRTYPNNWKLIRQMAGDGVYNPTILGRSCARNYNHKMKYIAVLDTVFYIKNNEELWDELCTNGIFDIWLPGAPYYNLEDDLNPMILLLRICEIKNGFSEVDIRDIHLHAEIIKGDRDVSIKRPIIPNTEFSLIKDKILNTLKEFGAYECMDEIEDTTQMFTNVQK